MHKEFSLIHDVIRMQYLTEARLWNPLFGQKCILTDLWLFPRGEPREDEEGVPVVICDLLQSLRRLDFNLVFVSVWLREISLTW